MAGRIGWYVVVEETTGSNDKRWSPSVIEYVGDREEAAAAALNMARHHHPTHPMTGRRRQIFRLDPHTYLVTMEGLFSPYHFRVSAAELVE